MMNEKTNSILGFRSFAPSLRSSLDLLGRSPMVAFLPGSEFFYFILFFFQDNLKTPDCLNIMQERIVSCQKEKLMFSLIIV